MKKLNILVLVFLAIISCKEDDNIVEDDSTVIDTTPKFGAVTMDFSNTIGTDAIVLNTGTYTNQSNEEYSISELKYIISNIVLVKANGEEFTYPVADSYFVVNEEIQESKKIILNDIDAADYTKVKIGFGVDQSNYPLNGVANFIPTAEESGMLWSWSAGYKFLKFEGAYTPQGGGDTADYILHIGSHGMALDNYKVITLDLPTELVVGDETSSSIAIEADIAKIFDSSNTHSLEIKSDVQVSPEYAPKIAENVSTMFNATTVTN